MYSWVVPPLFVALGFFLNSSLHTYYVINGRGTKIKYSYQIPDIVYRYTPVDDWVDSARDHTLTNELPLRYDWSKYVLKWEGDDPVQGVKRAGINGIVAGSLVGIFDTQYITPQDMTPQEIFKSIILFIILSTVILIISQRFGGGSLTKLVLDTLLLVLGSLLIVVTEFDVPVTFWRVYSVYISVIFGLTTVGIEWRNWVNRRGYDKIPSLIYYLTSMLYIVSISLFSIAVIELLLISP